MVEDKTPLVLSNYIFEFLEVNPGVAKFLIQLHPEDAEAVVEVVTTHTERGLGTKTTLYVGQEEEEEEEDEGVEEVGGGGRKNKPNHPLMISVQKVRIRHGKGKGTMDAWFPTPLTHNTCRVCTYDWGSKLPMHSLCPRREWECEGWGSPLPTLFQGKERRGKERRGEERRGEERRGEERRGEERRGEERRGEERRGEESGTGEAQGKTTEMGRGERWRGGERRGAGRGGGGGGGG